MEFGLFNLMSFRDHPQGLPGVIGDMRALVRLGEDIGFDTAWFAEHHFTNYSISVSPLLMASHMAAATSRIRLGSAVLVLPLYHPMRLAQEIALTDQLCDGRFVLGVGNGYQPFEFDRYGQDVTRRSETFFACWDLIEEALTTGRVAVSARAMGLPETPMLLQTVRGGLPPLYIASSDPAVLRRFGPLGATPFITAGWRGSHRLKQMAESLGESWRKAGLGARPMPLGLQQYIHVTDDPAQALIAADCARFVGRLAETFRAPDLRVDGPVVTARPLPDEPPLETFRDNIIIGPPEHVAERILDEIEAMAPTHYNCFFQFGGMPGPMALRSLERFGAEVMPLVRARLCALRAGPSPRQNTPTEYTA